MLHAVADMRRTVWLTYLKLFFAAQVRLGSNSLLDEAWDAELAEGDVSDDEHYAAMHCPLEAMERHGNRGISAEHVREAERIKKVLAKDGPSAVRICRSLVRPPPRPPPHFAYEALY